MRRTRASKSAERGAVGFVLVVILAIFLLGVTVVFFLPRSGHKSAGTAFLAPTSTQVSITWDFDLPAIEARDGVWVIEAEMRVASEEVVDVDVTRVFVERGAAVGQASFVVGPPGGEFSVQPMTITFDPLVGAGPVSLEILYRATYADGQETEGVRRIEFEVDE